MNDTDTVIIKRFIEGSEAAFDELVKKHSGKAYQVAYGLLGNNHDAEEVVQDAFIKVFKNLKKFRGDSKFTTWLYRIVTNLARNKYHWHRRRGAEVNVSISDSMPGETNSLDMDIPDMKCEPLKMLEYAEVEENLKTALERIPEKLREVIILRHFEEMSYSDIASILNCELGTVKSRLARARDALKKELNKLN
jgi:RNA polymerase sigma-70 factor (ECF subfamily)